MLLSTTLHSLLRQDFNFEQCISVATAGFDAMDMCFTHSRWHDAETKTPEFLNQLKDARNMLAKVGRHLIERIQK